MILLLGSGVPLGSTKALTAGEGGPWPTRHRVHEFRDVIALFGWTAVTLEQDDHGVRTTLVRDDDRARRC